MDRRKERSKKRLVKKSKRGFRGYPIGTLARYGPDDQRASKLVASIIAEKDGAPIQTRKWFRDDGDVLDDIEVIEQVTELLEEFGALSVVMPDRIIGCPHEEGIDYQGSTCPECPFWANRDRWTGKIVH